MIGPDTPAEPDYSNDRSDEDARNEASDDKAAIMLETLRELVAALTGLGSPPMDLGFMPLTTMERLTTMEPRPPSRNA